MRTHTAVLKVKPSEADHLCKVNLVFSLLEDDITANSGNNTIDILTASAYTMLKN